MANSTKIGFLLLSDRHRSSQLENSSGLSLTWLIKVVRPHPSSSATSPSIRRKAESRLSSKLLTTIFLSAAIAAKVHPPNPLFGRLWENLDEYVKRRKAQEVSIREATTNPQGLATQLAILIARILEDSRYQPNTPPDITDAAMLMAADGYGTGKAVSYEGQQESRDSNLRIPEVFSLRQRASTRVVSRDRAPAT